MKEKEKTPIIVPYAYQLDGNLMGNPAAHLYGLPVFVSDQAQEGREEDLLD